MLERECFLEKKIWFQGVQAQISIDGRCGVFGFKYFFGMNYALGGQRIQKFVQTRQVAAPCGLPDWFIEYGRITSQQNC